MTSRLEESSQSQKWFRVSLRIFGNGFRPDEATQLLRLTPERTALAGASVSARSSSKHQQNLWIYQPVDDSTLPFDAQISLLLDAIEPHSIQLSELMSRVDVVADLFLGFSSTNGQGGATFPSSVLSRIATLNLPINLDLYPPSDFEK